MSVSHDLRTPLTALQLYLDLLHKSNFSDKEKIVIYIEKSRIKATQIKRMSDQLFESFLISTDKDKPQVISQNAQDSFQDILSDMIVYLSEHNFLVETNINWTDVQVNLCFDYVYRIFDNINSNILKYAYINEPIKIEAFETEEFLVLKFENEILEGEYKPESTNIGIKNISTMMNKMGGNCKVNQTDKHFILELWFDIA